MAHKMLSELANSFSLGKWCTHDETPTIGTLQLAALIDIQTSLRAMLGLLRCPNVQGALIACQRTDRAIRAELNKRAKKRKRAAK